MIEFFGAILGWILVIIIPWGGLCVLIWNTLNKRELHPFWFAAYVFVGMPLYYHILLTVGSTIGH